MVGLVPLEQVGTRLLGPFLKPAIAQGVAETRRWARQAVRAEVVESALEAMEAVESASTMAILTSLVDYNLLAAQAEGAKLGGLVVAWAAWHKAL